MVRHLVLLAAAVWIVSPASAQLPDLTSLNGAYNVRYLGVNASGSSDVAVSFQGTLTFDGKGNFTVAGAGVTAGAALKFRTTGTYTVTSAGMAIVDNVFDPVTSNGTSLYGGVAANGVLVAGTTDNVYSDMLVAIPAAKSASAATLTGQYRVAGLEFLNGDFQATRDVFFPITADGKGGLGDVAVAGTALTGTRHVASTQTSPGATYTMTANGTGTLVFPAPSGTSAGATLLSGSKVLFVSDDGSFFVSGSASGYDLQVGVKVAGTTALNGLFWDVGLENYQLSSDPANNGPDNWEGSSNAIGAPTNLEFGHQRYNLDGIVSYDFTYADTFTFDSNGLASGNTAKYGIGANGKIVIGAGTAGDYFVNVLIAAPAMNAPSGTTVFLNPQGVVNAANNIPVTNSYSPGEVITLYGTGLGPSTPTTASAPFPTTLGGVQVMVNGTAAPVYDARAGQISAVIPYGAPKDGSFLQIQVINNGAQSNKVNVYSGPTSPGVFTIPSGGPFNGAIINNTNGTIVSDSNPVKVGDVLSLFLTGLGAVTPAVAAGTAAPSSPLSTITDKFMTVYIDGIEAPPLFAGLAPTLGGLYQVNLKVPTGVTTGSTVVIEVVTSDADNFEALLPIAK